MFTILVRIHLPFQIGGIATAFATRYIDQRTTIWQKYNRSSKKAGKSNERKDSGIVWKNMHRDDHRHDCGGCILLTSTSSNNVHTTPIDKINK